MPNFFNWSPVGLFHKGQVALGFALSGFRDSRAAPFLPHPVPTSRGAAHRGRNTVLVGRMSSIGVASVWASRKQLTKHFERISHHGVWMDLVCISKSA